MPRANEHDSHKRPTVAPLLDLSGWRDVPVQPASFEGQAALPGLEGVEIERSRKRATRRERRAEGEGQRHLF